MALINAHNFQPVQLDATEKIVTIHPTEDDVMILTQKPDPSSQARDYLSSFYLLYSLANQEPVFTFKGLLLYVAPDMSRIVRFSGHAIYDYEQKRAGADGRISYSVKNKIRIGTFIPAMGTITKSAKTGKEYFVYAGLTMRKQADTLSYFHQNDYSRPEKVMHMYYGYAVIDLHTAEPSESLVRTCILPIKRRNQIFSIRPNVDNNTLFISYINSKSLMLEISLDFNKSYKMYFKDEDTPIQYAPSDDSNHLIYPYLLQPDAVKNTLHQSILHMQSDYTFIRFVRDNVYLDVLYSQGTRESLWHLFVMDETVSNSAAVPTSETMTAEDLSASKSASAYGTYAYETVRNGSLFPFVSTGAIYYHDYGTNTLQQMSKKRIERFMATDLANRCACTWDDSEIDFFMHTPEFSTKARIIEISEDLFRQYRSIARKLVPALDALQGSVGPIVTNVTYAPNVMDTTAAGPSRELLHEIDKMKSVNKTADETLKTIRKELDILKEEKMQQDEELGSLKTAVETTDANYRNICDAIEELKEKQDELQTVPFASGAGLDKELIEKINAAADVAEQTNLIRNQVLEMDSRMAEVENAAAKLASDMQEAEERHAEERSATAALGDADAIVSLVNDVKESVDALKEQVKHQGDHIEALQSDYNGYKDAVNNRFVILEETILEVQRNIPIDDEDSFDFDPHSIRIDEEADDEEARVRQKYNRLLADDDDDDFETLTRDVQPMRAVPKEREAPPPLSEPEPTKKSETASKQERDEEVRPMTRAGPVPEEKFDAVERLPDADFVEDEPATLQAAEPVDLPISASALAPDVVERLPDVPPNEDDHAPVASTYNQSSLDDLEPITMDENSAQDLAGSDKSVKKDDTPKVSQGPVTQSPQADFEDLSVGGWTTSPDPKPKPAALPNAVQSPGDEFENLMKDDFDLGESATLNPNEKGGLEQDADDFAADFDDFEI